MDDNVLRAAPPSHNLVYQHQARSDLLDGQTHQREEIEKLINNPVGTYPYLVLSQNFVIHKYLYLHCRF